jgi:hypothetical protein
MLKKRQHENPRLNRQAENRHSTIESWREGANFHPQPLITFLFAWATALRQKADAHVISPSS